MKSLFITLTTILVIILSSSSCHKFSPESLISQPWHRILSFKNDGQTNVSITSDSRVIEGVKPLTILRTGSEISSESRAVLCLMSEDEVKALGPEYKIIDQASCKFKSDLHFVAGQTGATIEVQIDGAAILDKMRSDLDHVYVLPFKLQSSDSVNVYKNHMVYIFVDAE